MAKHGLGSRLATILGRAFGRHRDPRRRPSATPRASPRATAQAAPRATGQAAPRATVQAAPRATKATGTAYPGDFLGTPEISYSPNPGNGTVADPGEIVWTWVPFEENHSQGKDRPVLIIGADGPWLLALGLTSKDHDRDAAQEARAGRHWTDLGSGHWDPRRRPSEVRVDRILRVDAEAVRREGSVLDEARFNRVADAVRDTSRGGPNR